eukprot:TRINITY_DN2407_c0_g1_i2.p1 TRINITY_DN2407_c0_g1~~TRINITY_DN2407_c0_g1_i2.p1  ORF type:complete len:456 (+),score=135.73 TRINITY_DN2407_c0_g1_i2:77-1444(+)
MEKVTNRILRQRRQQESSPLHVEPQSGFERQFKKFDLYPKVHRDRLQKQTAHGRAISVCVTSVILLMVLAEFYEYIWGMDAYRDLLAVDAGITENVPINVNVTFYGLKCGAVHLNTKDASGEIRLDVNQDLYKSPVDAKGRILFTGTHKYYKARAKPGASGDGSDEGAALHGGLFGLMTGYDKIRDPTSKDFCGPCDVIPLAYEHEVRKKAEGEKAECCNTCAAVMDYHRKNELSVPDRGDIEQCVHEASEGNPGCNVAGVLTTEKVRGTFSFSPGSAFAMGGRMLRFVSAAENTHYNISHTVHHLSFGDQSVKRFSVTDKPRLVHPLDGYTLHLPHDRLGIMKYIVKAIPVLYTTNAASEDEGEGQMVARVARANSFEISVNSHVKTVPLAAAEVSPSISFSYDFHPMQITHVYNRPPLWHFLLELCKVVGGVFTVTGFLDRAVGKAFAALEQA